MANEVDDMRVARIVSCIVMVAVAGLSLAMITVMVVVDSRGWLSTLGVIVVLAIASNQAIYGLSDIKEKEWPDWDGLGKGLTQCAAPFAAVAVVLIVAGGLSGWQVIGFAPFVGLVWWGRRSFGSVIGRD